MKTSRSGVCELEFAAARAGVVFISEISEIAEI
jgi:hypothetical protein